MKTMKVIGLLAVMLVMVLAFSGTAEATKIHVVKKGEYLSRIAPIYNLSGWKELYSANKDRIKNPDLIYPGQKLVVPDENTEFSFENPGGDKYTGTLEEALDLLDYPEEVSKLFIEKINEDSSDGHHEISKGDRLAMVFGKNKIRRNTVANWKDETVKLASRKYVVIIEDTEYTLLYPFICGNWSRLPDKKIAVTPPPPPKKTAREPEPKIVLEQVETEEPITRKCPRVEHEPIAGAGIWGNGIGRGKFAYAEYMAWLKKRCDSEYSFGLGVFGALEAGDSKTVTYEWDGYGIGPQIGLKRNWTYTDKHNMIRAQQIQLKARLVWEHNYGESSVSGYKMSQDSLKLGIYTEYVREMNDKWLGILTAEGWHALDRSIDSTWSGDEPSNRNQFMLGAYAQHRFNDTWQTRFGGGPFYQGWDDMYGLHLRAELRWKEIIMIGPYVNLFPFGKSSTYDGVPTSDLQTIGAFVRLEAGPI
ncbi:MAG TPA: LysM domain-containing protein, partial [Candidatus Moranbacteria bacterium]|nr:LysM domain-containing protein [Candidatus Moranbacteria bacterium]